MTVKKLHRILGDMIAKGQGRRPVWVHKETFESPLEGDGAVILPAFDCIRKTVGIIDDDGDLKTRKDGQECRRSVVVMVGTSYDAETAW